MSETSPLAAAPANTPSSSPAPKTQAWWQSNAFFITSVVIATLAIAYAMSCWEVVSRAKEAYLEGQKYESWMNDPSKKKSYLDQQLAGKKITQDDYDRMMEDSDLKNAYVWYETVVDLFQPPRSQWVLKSEERLKDLKPKREAWLKSLGIDPVDDSAHMDTQWHW